MRILFAAEPDKEDKVRHLIAQALSGHLTFPDCFTTVAAAPKLACEISAEETGHAERLIHS